jgi:hypothetical protein
MTTGDDSDGGGGGDGGERGKGGGGDEDGKGCSIIPTQVEAVESKINWTMVICNAHNTQQVRLSLTSTYSVWRRF